RADSANPVVFIFVITYKAASNCRCDCQLTKRSRLFPELRASSIAVHAKGVFHILTTHAPKPLKYLLRHEVLLFLHPLSYNRTFMHFKSGKLAGVLLACVSIAAGQQIVVRTGTLIDGKGQSCTTRTSSSRE